MQQGSTVDWLSESIYKAMEEGDIDFLKWRLPSLLEEAKKLERERIIHSVIYSLDEDGHTGDWKIKFANDYYLKYCQKDL
jgi:hypothetical protein